MASENDSYSSGKVHEKTSINLQRRRSLKRKEAARRNLIDSIHTRQCDVRYSLPCLPSERVKSEVKFPRVNSKTRSVRGYSDFYTNNDNKISKHEITPNSLTEIADESGRTASTGRNGSFRYVNKSNGQSISLPEIIMEFNLETSMAVGTGDVRVMSPSPEFHDDERVLGAPYEEYLKRAKYNNLNPCRSRHRPVTPGLLDSLNKLKVPSKVKTEQWVRSTQSMQKSLKGHVYKTENIDNTSSSFPNWIYSD